MMLVAAVEEKSCCQALELDSLMSKYRIGKTKKVPIDVITVDKIPYFKSKMGGGGGVKLLNRSTFVSKGQKDRKFISKDQRTKEANNPLKKEQSKKKKVTPLEITNKTTKRPTHKKKETTNA